MISFDGFFKRGENPSSWSVADKTKLILQNEFNSREQKFPMIGSAGKHVFAYDVGGGTCVRFYHSGGEQVAIIDHQNYLDLKSAGFCVPNIRGKLILMGGKAAFAVDLITGPSIGENLTSAHGLCEKSDYMQIIQTLQKALALGWWPREFNIKGNTLKEVSSGRIFFIDVGEWKKISSFPVPQQRQHELTLREMIEIYQRIANQM
jgi:hypothetical protein